MSKYVCQTSNLLCQKLKRKHKDTKRKPSDDLKELKILGKDVRFYLPKDIGMQAYIF